MEFIVYVFYKLMWKKTYINLKDFASYLCVEFLIRKDDFSMEVHIFLEKI